jgi:peptide/nickel transport system permease protein
MGILAARRHNTAVDAAHDGVCERRCLDAGVLAGPHARVPLRDRAPGHTTAVTPFGPIDRGVFSIPYYEVWGWNLREGTFWASFNEYVANHIIFNTFITGQWSVWWDAVRHMILPAIALATIPLAIIARITRSSLLEAMNKDYIRTARAKGASETRVVRKHALRNSLLPVVTIIGLQLGALLGGAVLTETVFRLAGIGTALFDAITGRDYAVVQGFTVIIASVYVIVNLLVDLSYGYLDPRIRVK